MAVTAYEGVRAVLWLPVCQRHFSAATLDDVLNGDVIKGMQESIERDFRQNGSIPDWKGAKLQPLRANTTEFAHYEQQQHDLREGKVLPAQTVH